MSTCAQSALWRTQTYRPRETLAMRSDLSFSREGYQNTYTVEEADLLSYLF